jgi:CelD/BcsL family acetyltransferase involved in cellulose biosynthesis
MRALRFDLVETQEGFWAIEAQWRVLEARAALPNIYACFDWVTMAWSQSGLSVAIATVWDGDRLVLGLPLNRMRQDDGSSKFTGMMGAMIQFVDALIDGDADSDEAVAVLLAGLREVGRGTTLRLLAIPATSPLGSRLPMATATLAGRPAQVDMPAGFDAYFAGRSRGSRSHHRRMMRQLGATVRVADARSWEADLDWFLATKRAWTPPGGEPLRPWVVSQAARDGLVMLGQRWADDGRAVLTLLKSGGVPVAGCLSFRLGAHATFYATTYAAPYARYSPGMTALIESLRVLGGLGVTRINLMQNRAAYKERLKTSTLLLRSVKIDL